MTENQLTPAQKQYHDLKKQYQDCILFFRMGDFYEVFNDDARKCSQTLEIVLTHRDKNSKNPIEMAGVPHHSIDKHIPKLLNKGFKIAIAEQTSAPQPGKIVSREVTRVITPGTYLEDLSKNKKNILSIDGGEDKKGDLYHLAWGDFCQGEYTTKSITTIEEIIKHISIIRPVEIIIEVDTPNKNELEKKILTTHQCLISTFDKPYHLEDFLITTLGVKTLKGFGKSLEGGRKNALGLLLNYLQHTQKIYINNIVRISYHGEGKNVLIDHITIKNLEIFESSYDSSKKKSLAFILDQCATNAGSRLFKDFLIQPTQEITILENRLAKIEFYRSDIIASKKIIEILKKMGDLHKIVSTMLYRKNSPLLIGSLKKTLETIRESNGIIANELERWGRIMSEHKEIEDLLKYLQNTTKEEILSDDDEIIKEGFDIQTDEARKIAYHTDELLLEYQQELVQHSRVNNVKVKYISNQGYFLEVTPKDEKQLEESSINNDEKFGLIRRQTLKTGQRYTTIYLQTIEEKIIKAQRIIKERQEIIINSIKEIISTINRQLITLSEKIAECDIFVSFALFSIENNYAKPLFNTEGKIEILGGRHPVIEQYLPISEGFIPNDLVMGMGTKKEILQIITGPNMGGKSTFLRQNALIIYLAHCGLFVPAEKAQIPITDGIFARVGSGDNLTQNQSTFMTEMIEVANILHNATSQSFIIFDELGRGTSTYDGLALAKAIIEHITTKTQGKTLFATHYHELIESEKDFVGVSNHCVSVYETEKEIVFMKKIIAGGANKSYGIHVANLAGIPKEILGRAEEYLRHFENTKNEGNQSSGASPLFIPNKNTHYEKIGEKVTSLLQSININNITPLQALNILSKLKDDNLIN